MKVLLCFGTRPEAIKMAPVIGELHRKGIEYKICVTGQHREMLDQVMNFFGIVPDYDLKSMQPEQTLNGLSSSLLKGIDEILSKEIPEVVLVQGDTTSAFIASLAAFNRKLKIGHIEAGLRTYDLHSPFPEEGNRQLISRLANYHFVPTGEGKRHLINEGIHEESITITGNTIVDAVELGKKMIFDGFFSPEIENLKYKIDSKKKIVLVTGHRRENFGQGMEEICKALLNIATREDVQLIFPVHLNPDVKQPVTGLLNGNPNIILTQPVDYPTLLWLMEKCSLIISDSGGIQEEAPSFGKIVVVTRGMTERTEGLKEGFSFLAGTDRQKIAYLSNKILDSQDKSEVGRNPYGDGLAAKRIVQFLIDRN